MTGRIKEAGDDEQQQDNLGRGRWFFAAAISWLNTLRFQVLFKCMNIFGHVSKQKYK